MLKIMQSWLATRDKKHTQRRVEAMEKIRERQRFFSPSGFRASPHNSGTRGSTGGGRGGGGGGDAWEWQDEGEDTSPPLHRSAALTIHLHLLSMCDFVVTSLFGHEQWLRDKMRAMTRVLALTDLFRAWALYAGVAANSRVHLLRRMLREGFLTFVTNIMRPKVRTSRLQRGVGGRGVIGGGEGSIVPNVVGDSLFSILQSRGRGHDGEGGRESSFMRTPLNRQQQHPQGSANVSFFPLRALSFTYNNNANNTPLHFSRLAPPAYASYTQRNLFLGRNKFSSARLLNLPLIGNSPVHLQCQRFVCLFFATRRWFVRARYVPRQKALRKQAHALLVKKTFAAWTLKAVKRQKEDEEMDVRADAKRQELLHTKVKRAFKKLRRWVKIMENERREEMLLKRRLTAKPLYLRAAYMLRCAALVKGFFCMLTHYKQMEITAEEIRMTDAHHLTRRLQKAVSRWCRWKRDLSLQRVSEKNFARHRLAFAFRARTLTKKYRTHPLQQHKKQHSSSSVATTPVIFPSYFSPSVHVPVIVPLAAVDRHNMLYALGRLKRWSICTRVYFSPSDLAFSQLKGCSAGGGVFLPNERHRAVLYGNLSSCRSRVAQFPLSLASTTSSPSSSPSSSSSSSSFPRTASTSRLLYVNASASEIALALGETTRERHASSGFSAAFPLYNKQTLLLLMVRALDHDAVSTRQGAGGQMSLVLRPVGANGMVNMGGGRGEMATPSQEGRRVFSSGSGTQKKNAKALHLRTLLPPCTVAGLPLSNDFSSSSMISSNQSSGRGELGTPLLASAPLQRIAIRKWLAFSQNQSRLSTAASALKVLCANRFLRFIWQGLRKEAKELRRLRMSHLTSKFATIRMWRNERRKQRGDVLRGRMHYLRSQLRRFHNHTHTQRVARLQKLHLFLDVVRELVRHKPSLQAFIGSELVRAKFARKVTGRASLSLPAQLEVFEQIIGLDIVPSTRGGEVGGGVEGRPLEWDLETPLGERKKPIAAEAPPAPSLFLLQLAARTISTAIRCFSGQKKLVDSLVAIKDRRIRLRRVLVPVKRKEMRNVLLFLREGRIARERHEGTQNCWLRRMMRYWKIAFVHTRNRRLILRTHLIFWRFRQNKELITRVWERSWGGLIRESWRRWVAETRRVEQLFVPCGAKNKHTRTTALFRAWRASTRAGQCSRRADKTRALRVLVRNGYSASIRYRLIRFVKQKHLTRLLHYAKAHTEERRCVFHSTHTSIQPCTCIQTHKPIRFSNQLTKITIYTHNKNTTTINKNSLARASLRNILLTRCMSLFKSMCKPPSPRLRKVFLHMCHQFSLRNELSAVSLLNAGSGESLSTSAGAARSLPLKVVSQASYWKSQLTSSRQSLRGALLRHIPNIAQLSRCLFVVKSEEYAKHQKYKKFLAEIEFDVQEGKRRSQPKRARERSESRSVHAHMSLMAFAHQQAHASRRLLAVWMRQTHLRHYVRRKESRHEHHAVMRSALERLSLFSKQRAVTRHASICVRLERSIKKLVTYQRVKRQQAQLEHIANSFFAHKELRGALSCWHEQTQLRLVQRERTKTAQSFFASQRIHLVFHLLFAATTTTGEREAKEKAKKKGGGHNVASTHHGTPYSSSKKSTHLFHS